MSEKIPVYGSMKRPDNIIDGLEELKKNKLSWKKGKLKVTFETKEFTSVCPSTGQPDFCRIKISYVPDTWYIESKSMKFYLWSFREHGAHCEHLASQIALDIFDAISPKSVKVTVFQNSRGGIKLKSVYKL